MRAYHKPTLPLLALALALPTIASAQEADPASPAALPSSPVAVSLADGGGDAQAGSPFAISAVDDSKLGAIAGREDTTQIARNEQFAGVANNSVGDNAVTGDARISDNAFQNMSGLSILNVNTGNNVAINASMNVNVSISAAP